MKFPILNFILAILLILNIFLFHSPILGVIFGLLFIILSSYLLGTRQLIGGLTTKDKDSTSASTFFGFLTFLSITIIVLTIIYYFYQLNNYIITGYVILLSIIILFIIAKRFRVVPRLSRACRGIFPRSSAIKTVFNTPNVIFTLTYLFLLILSYFVLKSGQTTEAVRTPWHFVSKWFFVVYFLATVFLIYLITRLKTVCALILTSLHLFFTFSVANIIFPLGFGYDPFIHQATEKYILEHGFILPKPFYYLGQYSLVVFLTKIFQISHVTIDKFLVPFLASILLPVTIYYTFKKLLVTCYWLLVTGYLLLVTFLFLFIPFAIFTFTTPQNLADLVIIIIAFLGLGHLITHQPSIYFLLLLAILALITHPLAGLAVGIFIFILWLNKLKVRQSIKNLFYVFLCFCVFCVFMIFSFISPLHKVDIVNNFNLTNFIRNLFRFSPNLSLNTNFVHLLKTLAYFIYDPIKIFFIIFILSIIGLYFLIIRQKKLITNESQLSNACPGGAERLYGVNYQLLTTPLTTFIILTINSLVVFSFINFPFLIEYEQGDFSWRIFNLGVWFLIPLALVAIGHILEKIFKRPSKTQNIKTPRHQITSFHRITLTDSAGWNKLGTIVIAGILTTSLYFSYPRQDIYYYTRGFNTSLYDFKAIKYLEEITHQDYVVLANQQVGAAALSTFGFRYFDNKYFFYSIPTGGALYKVFAKMAYDEEISYETVKMAMDLTGVNIVYFYLNDYWFNFKYLVPQAKKLADETLVLENGKIWVFKFVRK